MENDAVLATKIETLAQGSKASRVAVVVHDLETSRRFSLHGEEKFHAASTIKVAVLLALYHAIDQGEVRASDPLHVRNRFRSAASDSYFRLNESSDGYGDLYRRLGRTARIGDLAEAMIIWSSNLATNLLVDFLGIESIQQSLIAAKVTEVDFRRGVDDEAAFAAGFNNETTASGLVSLFSALRGNYLSPEGRSEVIRILLDQRFNSMIPAKLPKHAIVAHKTGEISKVCHDAGIIYLPEREPYLLAILTENNADADTRRDLVARISRAVYQFVSEK